MKVRMTIVYRIISSGLKTLNDSDQEEEDDDDQFQYMYGKMAY